MLDNLDNPDTPPPPFFGASRGHCVTKVDLTLRGTCPADVHDTLVRALEDTLREFVEGCVSRPPRVDMTVRRVDTMIYDSDPL